MIGRNPQRPVEIVGDGYATLVREVTEAANRDVGLDIAFGDTEYSGASDHHPFFVRDVPVMFFFTGLHDDYHQLTDHADKLDYTRMEKVVRVAHGVIDALADSDDRPRFRYQVLWLGAEVRLDEIGSRRRAVIAQVAPGSRAERAGLAAGDVIAAV